MDNAMMEYLLGNIRPIAPMDFKVIANPPIQGMQNGEPNYGFGNRHGSNSPKGTGFFGLVRRPDGRVSTEVSIDNGHGEIPSMVPGLTPDELQAILTAKDSRYQVGVTIPDSVYRKAEAHANWRRFQGLPVFAGINDKPQPLPSRNSTLISDLLEGVR